MSTNIFRGRPTSEPVARPLSPPSPCESPAVPFRPSCGLVASSKTCRYDGTLYVHVHCNENLICVFLLWELRGLSPYFHIHVSVSDLYIFPGSVRIHHIYKEIQIGAVAKSYMRKGFLIYEEMRKYLIIYEEAVSHI